MSTNTLMEHSTGWASPGLVQDRKFKLTVFHCINALDGIELNDNGDCEIQKIQLPCSSMTREVVLLKAFESGADSAVVLVCPQGACRFLQGNIRAEKRVKRVKKILDEIGLDGRRLNIYNVPHGDQSSVDALINRTLSELDKLGPSPAA